jgi:hypothetical protein
MTRAKISEWPYPGCYVPVEVTRTQARQMAEAIWRLESTASTVATPTVKDQIALSELRRRLYLAARIGKPEDEP